MSSPHYKHNAIMDIIAAGAVSNLFYRKAVKIGLATLCFTFATTAAAEWNNNPSTETAYVDSIHQWGAWELDIEPAAGGITPSSNQVVNARSSKVSLRINSIAALAPVVGASAPLPPVTPVPPTIYIPPVTNISPTVPVPVGAP